MANNTVKKENKSTENKNTASATNTAKRLLIDAAHNEETRLAVIENGQLSEFDYETQSKKPTKGNIYLAKVTRVEPSLQAAFVDYGAGRQGFLAFSEIHSDYYRIPVADKIEEELALDEQEDEEDEDSDVETLGSDEPLEQSRQAQRNLRNHRPDYKIQEVIKRNQVMLVQVVREERGNKGAAMTTFLSLAGRYCVLMPNTFRGGGISRKINNGQDRKRLKDIVESLNVPQGMTVILRTAGAERSSSEIKRDYQYICKIWDEVRGKTLDSVAPCLINEEADIIHRALRDIYNNSIDEVLVNGDEAYKRAKSIMKNLMPSHAAKVKNYKKQSVVSLFADHDVDQQLQQIQSPQVTLRSGGYLVLHQTEALVAIDVNSGRSIKERHIEETALKTNLEAAEEISRQLRLRDLAGLVVIDFIDMEENRNNVTVERRLKELLRRDRARIQIGRISSFGLLEMSRQRLRPSLQESMGMACPYCAGHGYIPSRDFLIMSILRHIENEYEQLKTQQLSEESPENQQLIKDLSITLHMDNAGYLLNEKRKELLALEDELDIHITVNANNQMSLGEYLAEIIFADGKKRQLIEQSQQDNHQDRNYKKRNNKKRQQRNRKNHAQQNHHDASEDTQQHDGASQEMVETENNNKNQQRRKGRNNYRNNRRRQRHHDDAHQPQENSQENTNTTIKADVGDSEAKKTTSKKTTAKKASAKKTTSKKATTKKTTAKKSVAKKATTKKATAKAASVKSPTKTASVKKAASKKSDAKKRTGWWSKSE